MTESTVEQIFCVNHPNRATFLRCNRCSDPICPSCAVLTDTGYRCRNCVRGLKRTFDTARWVDYPVAILIAGFISFLGSWIASFLGFFTIFIAPVAGVIIAEAVRWAVQKRRAKNLFLAATVAAVVGSLPILLLDLFSGVLLASGGRFMGLLPLIFQGLYTFLVTSSVYYCLSGIRLR